MRKVKTNKIIVILSTDPSSTAGANCWRENNMSCLHFCILLMTDSLFTQFLKVYLMSHCILYTASVLCGGSLESFTKKILNPKYFRHEKDCRRG
jgi:hypothetical protein